MRKFLASIHKETLSLIRDIPGLTLLFIMPLFLVIVVTLTQMTAMRKINQAKVTLLLVDNDHSPLSKAIKTGLEDTGIFEIVNETSTGNSNQGKAYESIANGKYQIGIIIPAGSWQASEKKAKDIISQSFRQGKTSAISLHADGGATDIVVVLDPAINFSYKNSIISSLHMLIQGAEMKILTDNFSAMLPAHINAQIQKPIELELKKQLEKMENEFKRQIKLKMGAYAPQNIDFSNVKQPPAEMAKNIVLDSQSVNLPWKSGNIVKVKEVYAFNKQAHVEPTVVQNNVPGFALFAMFFIVIPLAGSLINERNEGAYNRLRTMPVSYYTILAAKTFVFLIVCLLQITLMFIVGIWAFPAFFNIPALEIGANYGAILLVATASALAAIGFGLLVGTLANTIAQAAMFGSVMVVILGIFGGIFIPVYLMPLSIKAISIFSPIRWGIDGFLNIFVRGGNALSVLPNVLFLVSFFAVAQFISLFSFVKRN
jgi:ABC-2 type transport system permease protein